MKIDYTTTKLLDDQLLASVCPALFSTGAKPGRSDRYGFVNSGNIVASLREAGYGIVWASQTRKRSPGAASYAQHYFRVRNLNDNQFVEGLGTMEMMVMNSHDGTSSFSVRPAIVSLTSNLPIIAGGSMHQVKAFHTLKGVAGVVDAVTEIAETFPRVAAVVKRMQDVNLTKDEVLEFARTAGRIRYQGKKAPFNVDMFADPRRLEQRSQDMWTVMNVVLENALMGGQEYDTPPRKNRGSGRRPVRGLRRIYGIAQVSIGLWNLAEAKLAEREN